MMLAIAGPTVVSLAGALLVVVGLGMVVVPALVEAWDACRAWYMRMTDPDGAHAQAKRDRWKVQR